MNAISTKNRGVQGEPAKKHWHVTSAALAVAVLAGGWSLSAQALVLGQIQVNSYIGEQLRAEVPVTQLSADEMASLTVRLADPNDFSGRGLVYNSAISSIRVVFEPTGNSTAVIRLTSARPIQDPFMDVLMDISWRTGSMQRSYTMLVDPPQTLSLESSAPPRVSVLQTNESATPAPVADSPRPPSSGGVASVPYSQGNTSSGTSSGDDIVIREHVVPASQADNAPRDTAGASQSGVSPSQRRAQQPAPQAPRQSSSVTSPDRMSTKVSRGQTLGQIASAFKPAGVTMEQMLAALYRANPGAFINKNINWVKAGATLVIPSDTEIASISQSEARSMVNAHARAFNQYRQQAALTSASSTGSGAQATAGGQTTGGEVTPQPNGQSTSTQSQDHLSITTTGSQANQDTQLAAQQQANDATTRHAGISSNIDDLKATQEALNGGGEAGSTTVASVSGTSSGQTQQAPQTQSGVPASVTPSEGGAASATDTPSQSTSEGVVTAPELPENHQDGNTAAGTDGSTMQPPPLVVDDTQSTATQPDVENGTTDTQAENSTAVDQPAAETSHQAQQSTDVPPPVAMPTQQEQSTSSMSFIDEMMENPLIPIGGLAVIALIAFGGVIIVRRRRAKDNDENVDDDEEAAPSMIDSFFADNISQQGSADASMLDQSSSLYAASQLDTNADVDPIQEADVYLAYGRDEQAAEILRDALSSDPNRVALSAKLCEVYARQGKINLFDEQAARLHALTSGRGAEWVKIAKLGRNISPSNSLFADATGASTAAQSQSAGGFAPQFSAQPSSGAHTDGFNVSQEETSVAPMMSSQVETTGGNVGGDSALSLDLPEDQTTNADAPDSVSEDDEGPATRLALAEEFLAIGNKNDAREIVQEVLAEGPSAEIKARAQSLLDQTK